MAQHDSIPAGRMERLIGKPPSDFTIDDLVDLVADRDIRLLGLMHVGGDGRLKTLDFAPRNHEHLVDVLEGGERADGSNLFKGSGIEAGRSDILLRPRLETAFLDPFSPEPTLAVICGHAGRDGEPLPESPDTILRRAWQRLQDETGIDLWALGEVEYFLGRRAAEGDIYGRAEQGYHATAPFVFGESVRRQALATLAEMGVPVKYGHSEVGYIEADGPEDLIWEQHEIELGLAPLPAAGYGTLLTQWVLLNLAHRNSMRLSYEPIVRVGHAGSGLHFHFSPVVSGEHVGGRGEDGELTDAAKWLIAGLVTCGGALMAFGNRSPHSFTRLTQALEAPNMVTWGEFDRSALVRLPIVASTEDGRRVTTPTVEFRLPDGSAHPPLLLAAVAQATVMGSKLSDLEAVLRDTESSRARVQPGSADLVPRSYTEADAAIDAHRDVFTAGGVFPAALLERQG